MKIKLLAISLCAVLGIAVSGCGPLVSAGPDVVVGSGIYPAPYLNPPIGPYGFRPGGPLGPGFIPGGKPPVPPMTGKPGNGNSFRPGYPGSGKPGGNPNGNLGNGGNNRAPGTGVQGIGNSGGNKPESRPGNAH